ncbi:MAG: hypothetical protein LBT23_11965 [Synergistaceae bacterium]|jgi:hypothetical protein|nr:hypothetical protein [Synergistaceae bacterium]
MSESLAKIIFLKRIAIWSFVSFCGAVAFVAIIRKTVEAVASGEEFFIPGIAVLTAGVLLVLVFGVTRVIKYIKLFRG